MTTRLVTQAMAATAVKAIESFLEGHQLVYTHSELSGPGCAWPLPTQVFTRLDRVDPPFGPAVRLIESETGPYIRILLANGEIFVPVQPVQINSRAVHSQLRIEGDHLALATPQTPDRPSEGEYRAFHAITRIARLDA